MCFRPPQIKKRFRCHKCNFLVTEGSKKCPHCGAEIVQMSSNGRDKEKPDKGINK
jgi:rRNA maturation endonuclease Nob1